jgi:hypothetical protein
MLARSGRLPKSGDYAYELKWDGFRVMPLQPSTQTHIIGHRSPVSRTNALGVLARRRLRTLRDPAVLEDAADEPRHVDMAGSMAVEAPQPSESSEPQVASRNRAWWRVKIPTAVIVTLVGIALSAWLLPAFTRQWDDRQKSNELKAALVADIATAEAKALSDGERVWETNDRATRSQAVRSWSLKSLEFGARIRANFSPELVAKWSFYSYAIHRLLGSEGVSGQLWYGKSPYDAASWLESLTPKSRLTAPRLTDELGTRGALVGLVSLDRSLHQRFLHESDRKYLGRVLHTTGASEVIGEKIFRPQSAFASLEDSLGFLGTETIDSILDAHARGYSTTKSDLINDLLPF